MEGLSDHRSVDTNKLQFALTGVQQPAVVIAPPSDTHNTLNTKNKLISGGINENVTVEGTETANRKVSRIGKMDGEKTKVIFDKDESQAQMVLLD